MEKRCNCWGCTHTHTHRGSLINNKRNHKGITLVSLIITIIVILILAVVTINTVNNNGILNYSQSAKNEYSQAQTSGKTRLNKYLKQLDTPGEEIKTVLNKILSKTENITVYDEYGNKITVPAGFKILVDGTTNYTADNINVTKGIVVEDEEGNQFVWIPVGRIYTNTDGTESKTITLGRYSNFTKNANGTYTVVQDATAVTTQIIIEGSYTEATMANHNSSYGNAIAKNIEEFCTKANASGGYYIARYEARVENYDASNISTTNSSSSADWTGYVAESGKSLKLVSKANSQVWNYVTQNKASSLCQSMYTNKPYESDLVNSYAWDTAIIFFQEFGKNSAYASKTSVNRVLANTGTLGTSYTGTKDTICNVYDMASNCMEWTTEIGSSYGFPCTVRGGFYDHIEYHASFRNGRSTIAGREGYTFRPLLYM